MRQRAKGFGFRPPGPVAGIGHPGGRFKDRLVAAGGSFCYLPPDMAGLLFLPQRTLDEWVDAGLVDVTSEGLRIGDAPSFDLAAAYRFLDVLEGEDTAGLLARVKTEKQLRAGGAELCGDSVILGEVVYLAEPGFLLTVHWGRSGRGMVGDRPGVGPVAAGRTSAATPEEAALLSEFLLGRRVQ